MTIHGDMASQTKSVKEVDSTTELNIDLLSELHDGLTKYSHRFAHT